MNIWACQVLGKRCGLMFLMGGLSSARNRAISFSEPNKSFANAWLLRTGCRTGCRGVNRISDNDEDIFVFLILNYEDNRQSCPAEISLERK